MVGTEDFGEDFGRLYFFGQNFAHEDIINSPADIARAGVGKVRPPSVMSTVFGKNSESIHETGVDKLLQTFRRAWSGFLDLFSEDTASDESLYDPVHVAGVIVGCFVSFGVLFWLLWSLLVCEGGIFPKIIPFFQVLFTSKTLQDFGYEGYPYQLGIFEGWIVNAAALVIFLGLIGAIWRLFKTTDPRGKKS